MTPFHQRSMSSCSHDDAVSWDWLDEPASPHQLQKAAVLLIGLAGQLCLDAYSWGTYQVTLWVAGSVRFKIQAMRRVG